MADAGPDKKGGIWYWIAGGCAVLVLVAVLLSCFGPMVVAMWFQDMMGGGGPFVPPVATGGGTPAAGLEVPLPPAPLRAVGVDEVAVQARSATFTVTESTHLDVPVGSTCSFVAKLIASPNGITSRCRTEITCGTTQIYGGSGQGYFDCNMSSIAEFSGWDYNQSGSDGDPMLTLDGAARTIRIEDEPAGRWGAFVVAGSLNSVAVTPP